MIKTEYTTTPVTTASGKDSNTRGVKADGAIEEGIKVSEAVKGYVIALAQEKSLKEEKEEKAKAIRAFVGKVRDYFIKEDLYQKTFRVYGHKDKKVQYAVDVTDTDKFSVPKRKEDIETIKSILGDKIFNEIFEAEVSIQVKKKVMENDKLRKELSKALMEAFGKEGIKKYFDRTECWKVRKGMAEDIHNYDSKIQQSFKEYIKQADDTIKDSSEIL